MNVKLTPEQKIHLLNSTDLYAIMQKILLRENKIRRNQEHFWIVGLDNRNKILFIELISLGAVNRIQVRPPEVFRMAIYKMAVKCVLVHNHPSGSALPSQPDLDVTNRMLKAGEIIAIDVIDHFIITEETYLSFADNGFMDQLRINDTYRVVGPEDGELRAMKIEIEKHQMKVAMVKKMFEDGMSMELIAKYAELTVAEVKQILKVKK